MDLRRNREPSVYDRHLGEQGECPTRTVKVCPSLIIFSRMKDARGTSRKPLTLQLVVAPPLED